MLKRHPTLGSLLKAAKQRVAAIEEAEKARAALLYWNTTPMDGSATASAEVANTGKEGEENRSGGEGVDGDDEDSDGSGAEDKGNGDENDSGDGDENDNDDDDDDGGGGGVEDDHDEEDDIDSRGNKAGPASSAQKGKPSSEAHTEQ